MQPDFAIPI